MVKTAARRTPFKVPRNVASDPGLKSKKITAEASKKSLPFQYVKVTKTKSERSFKSNLPGLKNLDKPGNGAQYQTEANSPFGEYYGGEKTERPQTLGFKTAVNSTVISRDVCIQQHVPISLPVRKIMELSPNEEHVIQVEAKNSPLHDYPTNTDSPKSIEESEVKSLGVPPVSEQTKKSNQDGEQIKEIISPNLCRKETSDIVQSVRIFKENKEKLQKTAEELSRLIALVHQARTEIGVHREDDRIREDELV